MLVASELMAVGIVSRALAPSSRGPFVILCNKWCPAELSMPDKDVLFQGCLPMLLADLQ